MHVGVCQRIAEEEETEDFRTQEELEVLHAKTLPVPGPLGPPGLYQRSSLLAWGLRSTLSQGLV